MAALAFWGRGKPRNRPPAASHASNRTGRMPLPRTRFAYLLCELTYQNRLSIAGVIHDSRRAALSASARLAGRVLFAAIPASALVGCRPATLEAYRTALNHWGHFAAEIPVERIDEDSLARFATYCLDLHGPVTCNKHVRHLLTVLRFAIRQGRLAKLPEWKKLREPLRRRWPSRSRSSLEYSAPPRRPAAGLVPYRRICGGGRSS